MPDRRQFRDASHYRLAVASEVLAPALRIAARIASRSRPLPPDEWRTGVILGQGHIGDVLFRTCSLDLLAEGLPGCKWYYLTTPSAGAVLCGNPALSGVLPWMQDGDVNSFQPRRYKDVLHKRFDVALCSDHVAHHRALILALRLGIPNRVAFTRKGLSGLTTRPVVLKAPMSHSEAFRRMVQAVTGSNYDAPLRPQIFPSQADLAAADHEWARLRLSDSAFTVACSMTTRQSVADYPPELFVEILRRFLASAPTARIVLTGVADDSPLLEAAARELGQRAVVSAGRLGVLAFGAMLARCSVFLGTDSGSRHLANAVGMPVFFVRNMTTTAVETGVYCPTETDIAPPGEYLSRIEMRAALQSIDCDTVAAALLTAGSQRARDMSEDTLR